MTNVRDPNIGDLFAGGRPRWRFDGDRCPGCGKGAMRVVILGDECHCKARGRTDRVCQCLAEGYAECDAGCEELAQIFPYDVVSVGPVPT